MFKLNSEQVLCANAVEIISESHGLNFLSFLAKPIYMVQTKIETYMHIVHHKANIVHTGTFPNLAKEDGFIPHIESLSEATR